MVEPKFLIAINMTLLTPCTLKISLKSFVTNLVKISYMVGFDLYFIIQPVWLLKHTKDCYFITFTSLPIYMKFSHPIKTYWYMNNYMFNMPIAINQDIIHVCSM
jgi:hypothetical protein